MNLVKLVEDWAEARNLVKGSDPKSQLLKTMSELGELADGINKNRLDEIKDGIGDVTVTLIIVAKQLGLEFNDCLAAAYDEIKDRKGRMVNGVFIKEGDVGQGE
jgi:NTP pyrophosphatase (non-canonical NTP hydrolase)